MEKINFTSQKDVQETVKKPEVIIQNPEEEFIWSFDLSPRQRRALREYIKDLKDEKHAIRFLIKPNELIPNEIYKSEYVKNLVKNKVYKLILNGEGEYFLGKWTDIMNFFGIEEEFFKQKDFDNYRKNRWLDRIEYGSKIDDPFRYKRGWNNEIEELEEKEEKIKKTEEELRFGKFEDSGIKTDSLEVKKIAMQGIIKNVFYSGFSRENYKENIAEYKELFHISEAEFEQAVVEEIKKSDQIVKIKENDILRKEYPFIDIFLNSQEAKEIVKKIIVNDLEKQTYYSLPIDKIRYFSIPESEFNEKEIKDKQRINEINFLKNKLNAKNKDQDYLFYEIERASEILSPEDFANIFNENIDSDNLIIAVSQGLRYSWNLDKDISLFNKIGVPVDVLKKASARAISNKLAENSPNLDEINEIKGKTNLSDEEYRQALTLGIINRIVVGSFYISEVERLQQELKLENLADSPEIQEKLKTTYLENIETGRITNLEYLDKNFKVQWKIDERPKRKKAVEKMFLEHFRISDFNSFGQIREFIDNYYPETHKFDLWMDKEIKEVILKMCIDFAFIDSSIYYQDVKMIDELTQYFGIPKYQIIEEIKKKINEGNFIRMTNERYSPIKKFFPEIDIDLENKKCLENHGREIIEKDFEYENWDELNKIKDYNDPKLLEMIRENISLQVRNLADKNKSPELIEYAINAIRNNITILREISFNTPETIKIQNIFNLIYERDWVLSFPDFTNKIRDFIQDQVKYFVENPVATFEHYEKVKEYLEKQGLNLKQTDLDLIFEGTLRNGLHLIFKENNFPFTPEQQKIIDIFTKINNSPSHEMKNLALELSSQLVYDGNFSKVDERFNKIENIFVRNNIPFVGKQAKICEALHPEIKTQSNSSPELQSLHSNNARRLLIFKDLLMANFNSLNSNLEQYLLVFKNGQEVLDKYEKGEKLSKDEEERLKYFFKKVNALSENTRKTDKFNKFDLENLSLADNLEALKSNFGIKENQTITQKFEATFLKRVGIDSFSEALKYYDKLREEVTNLNKQLAISEQINLGENDLAKGIYVNYFDSYLDRGVYAPEFIGAESIEAKNKAKGSDSTPWDTDLIKVGSRDSIEIVEKSTASGFGDIILIIKDRGQFNKNKKEEPLNVGQNKLELFEIGGDHYGIRTGFGSTEISAVFVKDNVLENSKQLESLKFSIAKKGFYIPICDKFGKVIFMIDEFNEYRQIFNGVDKYHGDKINLSEDWKNSQFSEEIKKFSQTNENLEKINKIKENIYLDIENGLKTFGIELHKGRYDDSVVGARIIDTGSTGRGAALDEGYDFDFVIKINDRDADKINQIAENLKSKYPYEQSYERDGMRTFRFKNFEKDGNKIDLDISFVKKSDSEELDANEAIAQKYDSIKKSYGEDKLLDVLTNIRFAKKELKNAGCYKKGLTGNGEQQGGLGGIGVENWILKNGGDAIVAFKEFNKNAYQDGELISFNDFKNKYKIFSAGNNIRGEVKAENFVYNMDEVGYKKMAELSREFVE